MKPHTYRFVFAALLLTMLAIFGIAFTADSEPQNSSLKTDGMKDAKLAEEKMMSKQEERIVSKDKKILVVCYSFSRGNTRKIAKQLQTVLDADYAEIEPTHPYPPYGGWNSEVTEQGKREVEAGFMPEIKPLAVNIADYDIIAVGTPTWWFTMAPPMHTFLKSQDWTGKTVIPFMTHGGWPGHVITDIKEYCAGAEFAADMEIQFDSEGGDHMLTSQADIDAWLEGLRKELR